MFIETLIAILLSHSLISAEISQSKEAGVAISKLVERIFEKEFSTLDIITFSRNPEYFDETINEIIGNGRNKDISIRVLKNGSRGYLKITNSAILLFEKADYLAEALTKMTKDEERIIFKNKVLAYMPSLTSQSFNKVTYTSLRLIKWYLYRRRGVLEMRKPEIMTLKQCRSKKFKYINSFSKRLMDWKNNNSFGMETFTNFYGCQFVYQISRDFPNESWKASTDKNGQVSYQKEGFNVLIVNEIARALNINVFYNPRRTTAEGWELIFPQYKVDIISSPALKESDVFTQHYMYDYLGYLAPPGETYTNFEKLFLAFDSKVWIWIGVTFSVAFVVIFGLKFTSKTVQKFVFGSRVTAPWFNVVSVFFGIGQVTLPQRNFSRFLLMSFILYSLIIRTAYQGRSFEILQEPIYKKAVTTVGELGERDWPVLSHTNFSPMVFPYR